MRTLSDLSALCVNSDIASFFTLNISSLKGIFANNSRMMINNCEEDIIAEFSVIPHNYIGVGSIV